MANHAVNSGAHSQAARGLDLYSTPPKPLRYSGASRTRACTVFRDRLSTMYRDGWDGPKASSAISVRLAHLEPRAPRTSHHSPNFIQRIDAIAEPANYWLGKKRNPTTKAE
jgi:hypothetical protein